MPENLTVDFLAPENLMRKLHTTVIIGSKDAKTQPDSLDMIYSHLVHAN